MLPRANEPDGLGTFGTLRKLAARSRRNYSNHLIAKWDQEAVHAEGLAADAQLSKDHCLLCVKACKANAWHDTALQYHARPTNAIPHKASTDEPFVIQYFIARVVCAQGKPLSEGENSTGRQMPELWSY